MNIYSNVLVCTDFSESSVAAAAKANEIATTLGAALTVIHVVTYVPPAYAGVELPKELSTAEYMIARAEQHLKNWCSQYELLSASQIIETGNAKKAIAKYVETNDVDLVVIGDKGESVLMQPFGSVATFVVHHCGCDVLVVR